MIAEMENAFRIILEDSLEISPMCGRGTRYTSTKLMRLRKQPVLITREIPHCPRQTIEVVLYDPLSVRIFHVAVETRRLLEDEAMGEQDIVKNTVSYLFLTL